MNNLGLGFCVVLMGWLIGIAWNIYDDDMSPAWAWMLGALTGMIAAAVLK